MYQATVFTLRLRNEELEEELYIPLSREVGDALVIQWERCQSPDKYEAWIKRLRAAMQPAVSGALDADLRPPTSAQVNHAIAIARQIGVDIPSEALRSRSRMQQFLKQFAD